MTETLATNEPMEPPDPLSLLRGDLNFELLTDFRNRAFRSIRTVEHLRDWLSGPEASGTARSVVLWALGRHEDAIEGLAELRSNPAVADCLARSYTALGRIDEVEKVLTLRLTDPRQAFTWLLAVESLQDAERLLRDALVVAQ